MTYNPNPDPYGNTDPLPGETAGTSVHAPAGAVVPGPAAVAGGVEGKPVVKKRRRWLAPVITGVLAFTIGAAAGSAGWADDATDPGPAPDADVSAAIADIESEPDTLEELETVSAERDDLSSELEEARSERDGLAEELQTASEERDAALASAEEAESVQASEPEPDEESAGFGDGTWRVGEDIEPGVYRTDGTDSCYWERLSGFSGEFGDIIANDFSSGPATVTIAAGDAGFTSQRCGIWELQE